LLIRLACERLQIDLLLSITSIADELSRGTDVGDLERLKPQNRILVKLSQFQTTEQI